MTSQNTTRQPAAPTLTGSTFGIMQINPLLATVIEEGLTHPSELRGSFDFLKADDRWEKVSRLDGQLPFTAVSGTPNVDTSKIVSLYRSDDAIFVEISAGIEFIKPGSAE